MPTINIVEKHLTRPTGMVDTDIVYIPGSANKSDAPELPVLCSTVSDLTTNFGTMTKPETDEALTVAGYASYMMAKQLLEKGMMVLYENVDLSYDALSSAIERLSDKGSYNVKYITSGGFANYGSESKNLYVTMLSTAANRGDCVALIETKSDADFDGTYKALAITSTGKEYGAMFAPWRTYDLPAVGGAVESIKLPGCFAYLSCLASSLKTSPNWLAIAGVTRGVVADLSKESDDFKMTNVMADNLQPTDEGQAVNAITEIKPYGDVIWGNRTLASVTGGLNSKHFLNTRNMINDIKKVSYTAAKELMFEQNSDTLWARFKSRVTPLLEQLKSGNGISDYKLIKTTVKEDGTPVAKYELACNIRIYPIYAVEAFDITVSISDQDASVGE